LPSGGLPVGVGATLNRSEQDLAALAPKDLSGDLAEVAAFPIAAVAAGGVLPLGRGVNPAWVEKVGRFRRLVVEPILGAREHLTEDDWQTIRQRFSAYEAWQAAKPVTSVETLGADRIRAILNGGFRQNIDALLDRDLALEPEANAIASVDRLVLYHRDLHKLLVNFVSFRDFYTRRDRATFQAGTLYIDGRHAELCIRIADIAKHSALATLGRIYLVYCECRRKDVPAPISIVAAITAGDSDQCSSGAMACYTTVRAATGMRRS
jgi:hypothetical protein